MRVVTVVAAACALALGSMGCAGEEPPDDTVPVLVGTVDLEIGQETGEAPYLFGRVSDVAAGADGTIFVADGQADEVRVFDADGVFAYAIGRSGQGPGELGSPCCLSFGPQGRLWVRDRGNSRYQAFTVGEEDATFATSLSMHHQAAGLWAPLHFDAQGNLIDVGSRPDPDATVRLHVSPSGDVVSEASIPAPDPTEIGMHVVEGTSDGNRVWMYLYQPFGPRHLIAHGPDRWATAISSQYRVTVFRAGSQPLEIVGDPGDEVPLSAAERERADEQIARDAERVGMGRGQLPYGVPIAKPPLRSLFFDRDRNLWVELTGAESADREADVYGPDGQLLQHRVWPGDVSLNLGWASGDTALGTRTDEEGVVRVVRLRFRARRDRP